MKFVALPFGLVLFAIAACTPVEPPKTPAEKHARMAEAADLAFDRCGQFMMGGFSDATQLKQTRDQQRELAKKAGASAALFAQAKKDVTSTFESAAIWTDTQSACNSLITEIARQA